MKLTDLNQFNNITIQCHDNPDADAIGSGFALYYIFKTLGKEVSLIYSGNRKITKVDLLCMIKELNIPISYVDPSYEISGLLVTIDCQYGSKNVTKLKASKIAIIDHHQMDPHVKDLKLEFCEIFSNYGSCSSIIYQWIILHNLEKKKDSPSFIDDYVNTALLYGLFMDTNEFSEIKHEADKDLRNIKNYKADLFNLIKSSNFNIEELKVIANAIGSIKYYPEDHFAIIKTDNCDPNILGYISDLCNHTNNLNSCVVYMPREDFYKLSVRSSSNEIRANELAAAITSGIGNGGGHIKKAGGIIFMNDYRSQYPNTAIDQFIYQRYLEFYTQSDYIYNDQFKLEDYKDQFELYIKKDIVLGYIPSEALKDFADEIRIETLEGKTELPISENNYIMCGIKGELYPINKDRFDFRYTPCLAPLDIEFDYEPRVYNNKSNEIKLIRDLIIPCRSKSNNKIYAKKLTRITRIIQSKRNSQDRSYQYENYMTGLSGDYIAINAVSPRDVYSISKEVFDLLYEKIE